MGVLVSPGKVLDFFVSNRVGTLLRLNGSKSIATYCSIVFRESERFTNKKLRNCRQKAVEKWDM